MILLFFILFHLSFFAFHHLLLESLFVLSHFTVCFQNLSLFLHISLFRIIHISLNLSQSTHFKWWTRQNYSLNLFSISFFSLLVFSMCNVEESLNCEPPEIKQWYASTWFFDIEEWQQAVVAFMMVSIQHSIQTCCSWWQVIYCSCIPNKITGANSRKLCKKLCRLLIFWWRNIEWVLDKWYVAPQFATDPTHIKGTFGSDIELQIP